MIVVMERGATEEQIEHVIDKLVALDFSVHRSTGEVHTILGGIGPDEVAPEVFEVLDGVKECYRIVSPYKLASRSFRPEGTVVKAGAREIGGAGIEVVAGVSRVESAEHLKAVAAFASASGAGLLQCGLRPDSREADLAAAREAASAHGLAVVVEATDSAQVERLAESVDAIRIGGRHMQNEALLEAVGACGKPAILNRDRAATIDEWLMAAETLLKAGNYQVVLCERGIRTFETHTRLTMDVSAIAAVKRMSHLPVIADPSKATGRRDRVLPMARAAVAAGADGLLIDIHPDPESAVQDGPQALKPEQFAELMQQVAAIAAAMGRGR